MQNVSRFYLKHSLQFNNGKIMAIKAVNIPTVRPHAKPAAPAHARRLPVLQCSFVLQRSFESLCRGYLLRYYCPVTVEGLENVPKQPFVFCSNHCSHLDSIVLMAASGLPFRGFALLAAADYFFDHPVRRRLVSALLTLIPLHRTARHTGLRTTIGQCREFLASGGQGIIIYPEGTRSQDGEIQPFRRGAAVLAMALRVPVVPAHIEGTTASMPKGAVFPRPGRITVRIGQPLALEPDCICEARPAAHSRQLTATLQQQVRALHNASTRPVVP